MLRTTTFTSILVGLSLLLTACSGDKDPTAAVKPPQKLLYLQMAAEGALKEDDSIPNQFILILKGITQHLPYFSEQPGGATGKLSLQDFLAMWQKTPDITLGAQHNGALITVVADETNVQHYRESAMVLSSPRFDVSSEELIFTVHEASDAERLKPGVFSEPLLFIDSWDFGSQ